MTRAEELSQNLRLEYLFYQRYIRWQQGGDLTRNGQIRLENTIRAIRNLKQECQRELPEEEYPEEYYYDDPEVFEIPEKVPKPEEKLTTIKTQKAKILDNDGTQMNIMDYMQHDGNICWKEAL